MLVSFELDEVMSISDRILVMYEGKIVGDFKPDEITIEELGLYMAGVKRDESLADKEYDKVVFIERRKIRKAKKPKTRRFKKSDYPSYTMLYARQAKGIMVIEDET